MTSSFEPRPPSPSLAEFAWAVRDENTPLVHEFAIRMLEAHFDDTLANQPELWTPDGPHGMLLRQTCKSEDESQALTAGSITTVRSHSSPVRRYGVSAHHTSGGSATQHTAEWRKGDSRMKLVQNTGSMACGTSTRIMPIDMVDRTIRHAHPELTDIVRPTGFRAFMRRLGLVGVRTLMQSQSRHPGMIRPFDY